MHKLGLGELLDELGQAFFDGRPLTKSERASAARAIVATHQQPGAYAGMFALSPEERKRGFKVFTGELMASASARHIAAEEALRALYLLEVDSTPVRRAMDAANAGMLQALARETRGPKPPGRYCCGKCTVSVWRTLLAGGLDQNRKRLENGMTHLKAERDGAGGWKRFPFFYTLLALVEVPSDAARRELRYARGSIERELEKRSSASKYARRRRVVLERALARQR